MKISKNNLWVKLANFAKTGETSVNSYYINTLPKSICPLFWLGLLGIVNTVLFIPQIISKIFTGLFLSIGENIIGNLILGFILIMGFPVYSDWSGICLEDMSWYHGMFGMGMIIGVLVVCFIALITIMGLVMDACGVLKKTAGAVVNSKSVPVEYAKTFKSTVCPLVEYKD